MIVYPAYIYMGGDSGPANPVIFQGNKINYNYSGRNYTVESNGIRMMTGISGLEFTGLDLSNFVTLKVEGSNDANSGVSIGVKFIDSSGNASDTIIKNFSTNSTSYNLYDIPVKYRNPNTEIKFSTSNGRNILLTYAILS